MNQLSPPETAWQGKRGPQLLADVYSRAAAIVDRRGYYSRGMTDFAGGAVSACLAVELAARQIFGERQEELGEYTMNAMELADDASDRLCGLLLFTGLVQPGRIGPSQLDSWDADGHGKGDAIAMLGMAAFAASLVAGTVA